ncbi:MAG: tRNA (N(6)-L-threonylcarbamoyladenosine(37)-C(2))-methylthiotransferase MtaB [Thermodesulfobacteriota bacterium]
MRKRLAVVTAGCKANFAESAGIASRALRAGFDVVPPGAPADVLIINSCTVTHRADRDSRAMARRLRRKNPAAVLVMTGCFARVSPDARGTVPEADHWIGARDPGELDRLLRTLADGVPGEIEEPSAYAVDRLLGHTRTFLRIQDGCDAACAYCIVPKARGSGRSVPAGEAVAEARRAEADGAREIVLTGIHAGRYGADRGELDGLANLLEELLSATSACRFRLGSVEPLEITPRLVRLIASGKRVCPHLHVPMQSGSDAVLRRMRRPYTSGQYREKLEAVRSCAPDARLGADVMAGFPGETEKDFAETLERIAESPLSYLHAFPYSPRPGTESAAWRDGVCAAEKKRRVGMLLAADGAMRKGYLEAQAGRTLSVIAESETGEAERKTLKGTSENYIEVVFPAGSAEVGELVAVRILGARNGKLEGRIEGDDGRA